MESSSEVSKDSRNSIYFVVGAIAGVLVVAVAIVIVLVRLRSKRKASAKVPILDHPTLLLESSAKSQSGFSIDYIIPYSRLELKEELGSGAFGIVLR